MVSQAMQGKATELPVYFWLADPELEARAGDVVGVRCWFKRLEFLERGGPFRRGSETRREWCDRLQPDEYDWPTVDELMSEMDEVVTATLKVDESKSFQLEVLGPTEYSEYSCSSGKTPEAMKLNQVTHQFDFSVLTILDPRKADMIHRRFFDLLFEVARRATEYDGIDSIRIADDFCTYAGSIYRPDFTDEILGRQVELGKAITKGGKYSVLHSDGDLRKHLLPLAKAYSGFHPLDIGSKSTVADAHEWATALKAVRALLPETVFFTGIPVDLLCSLHVSADELVEVVRHVVESVGRERLVLTTTHRPYPGWSFYDFEEKAHAVKHFIRAVAMQTT
ncbi:MAG: hypothetical protein WCC94_05280 [Candidatus Bathyarchaeia archaeon]